MVTQPVLNPQITKAVELLKQGEVVAIPTETVYGLAARIDDAKAVEKIFQVKQRPFFDPLIVHVASLEQAKSCTTDWPEVCDILARSFWPGPLTMVLPKSALVSDVITSGLVGVGLRWPSHAMAQEIIRQVGIPLAAPSANKFGRTSPTKAQHVRDEFGDSIYVVDGDSSSIGIESTVLLIKRAGDTAELSVLRKGAVLASQIDAALVATGLKYRWVESVSKAESPGHMKHHYMPSVPLVICKNPKITFADVARLLNEKMATLPDEVEGVKIVKPKGEVKQVEILRLSDKPEQAARELYAQLRSASERAPDALCFIQSSKQSGELWESIFDRLYKAASLILE